MIQCQEQIRNVAWSPIKREIKSVGWQIEVHQTKYSNISKFPFMRCTLPTTTTVTFKATVSDPSFL